MQWTITDTNRYQAGTDSTFQFLLFKNLRILKTLCYISHCMLFFPPHPKVSGFIHCHRHILGDSGRWGPGKVEGCTGKWDTISLPEGSPPSPLCRLSAPHVGTITIKPFNVIFPLPCSLFFCCFGDWLHNSTGYQRSALVCTWLIWTIIPFSAWQRLLCVSE